MADTTTRNGELKNRVQQLRLNNQLGTDRGSGRGGAAWLPWILSLVLAVTWAGVGIRSYRNTPVNDLVNPNGTTDPDRAKESSKTIQVPNTSTPVVAGTIEVEVKGYLVPAQQIAVSPIDVGGRVVELNVVEGKFFRKGEILAKLEDTNYQAQAAEAKAALVSAQARLENAKQRLAGLQPESVRKVEIVQVEEELKEAEAQRSRMADELARQEKLGVAASEREMKQARFDLQANEARVRRLSATLAILKEGPRREQKAAAEAEVAGADAEVKVATARMAQAQWRLDNCIIRAPIDGTILSKKAELGNLVNPMAFSASSSGGGAVCDIANLADLEVDLEIPERDIRKLRLGQRCRIKADAFSERTYEGALDRIMPIANRAKSIVSVRVKVKLPDGETPGTYLKPEMGAIVSFLADEGK
ncbi:MAG: efflux RND transporter periplasmic adaptor subunit [Planctomycetia bacterium]|nr:efflux RND transporter periplasmic adaptor subunit [Planctomycetia bacterium]